MTVQTEAHERLTRTPEELLSLLGLSRPTVYRLLKSGELRSIKVGRKILIPLAAIDEFLNGTSSEGK